MAPRVLVVSPRPARADGRGDQRRTTEIISALAGEFDVTTLSWLPDVGVGDWRPSNSGGNRARWKQWARTAVLAMHRPAQVAYVQSLAPPSLTQRLEGYDLVLFVTDRVVPRRLPAGALLVDFIDDLGESALRRGRATGGPSGVFWRIEGHRLRRFDRKLASTVRMSVAHSSADAGGIHPAVRPVPLSIATRPLPEMGRKVVFFGNLFYQPNHEAALWICNELAPRLAQLGIEPASIVVAGRRPGPTLFDRAGQAGIDLRADLPDLNSVVTDAAVVLAPMALGAGFQYKVLDACGAGRACVISPLANAGLGLVDEQSALVRDRSPGPFADAVARLLADDALRTHLAAGALAHVAPFQPEHVGATWRHLVRETIGGESR
jgi:glycosyltransferase involved in cell wall biosynthesis